MAKSKRSKTKKRIQPTPKPNCPYCLKKSILMGGNKLYGQERLKYRLFYVCQPCKAWVGCHPDSDRPLGTIAKPALRRLRREVHRQLDPLWQKGKINRHRLYKKLAQKMEIDPKDCHVGFMDEPLCKKALRAVAEIRREVIGDA